MLLLPIKLNCLVLCRTLWVTIKLLGVSLSFMDSENGAKFDLNVFQDVLILSIYIVFNNVQTYSCCIVNLDDAFLITLFKIAWPYVDCERQIGLLNRFLSVVV